MPDFSSTSDEKADPVSFPMEDKIPIPVM
jgi:hypothetical protein